MNQKAKPIGLAVASGIAYAYSFPPTSLSILSWVCLVPLLFSLSENWKTSAWLGFVAGFTANLFLFAWFWRTFNIAGVSFPLTFLCWLTMAAMMAIYFSAFGCLFSFVKNSTAASLLGGTLWVSLEYVREQVLTGFPWMSFSHTQAYNLALLQGVSIFGATWISFLLVSINISIFSFIRNKGFKKKTFLILPFVLLVSSLGFGWMRLSQPEHSNREIKLGLLQANIDQYAKWDDAYEKSIRDVYSDQVKNMSEPKVDLMVWSESAVPGWYPNEKFYDQWVKNLVQKSNSFHIVGAVTQQMSKEFNSAFLVTPDGKIKQQYDKQHLVPWGEYIPLGAFLIRWVPYLGQIGTFDRGKGDVLFDVNGFKILPTICYEAIFPDQVRRGVKLGANAIVNLTNDGWYLDTDAPEHHFLNNIFRAIENGVPLIRVANTGISAIVGPRGNMIFRSKLMVRDAFFIQLKYSEKPTSTIYQQGGYLFSPLVLLFMVLFFCGFFWTKKNLKPIQ